MQALVMQNANLGPFLTISEYCRRCLKMTGERGLVASKKGDLSPAGMAGPLKREP